MSETIGQRLSGMPIGLTTGGRVEERGGFAVGVTTGAVGIGTGLGC
jgi:hypothetical protein